MSEKKKNTLKFKGKGFGQTKSGNKERKNWADQFEPVRWTSQYADKTMLVRFVSDLFPVGIHWVYTSLEDLGKNSFGDSLVGKRFMVTCPDWNPEEERSSKSSCYICKHLSSSDMLGGIKITWYVQAFVAKKKDGKIKWGSEPVVLEFPTTAINEIKTMMETVGNGVEPADPKHGYAIWITYKSGTGKSSWSCQKDSEITLKELKFSKDDIIDFGEYFEPTPASDIDESMDRLGYVEFIENGGKKKKSKSIDDDDDDEDLLDEDDDEDEKPSKKKKSKDDDDDEDDEDEKPSKKKKSKDDDDDDEDDEDDSDDEDEDDDDDEDEKPSKKKGKFDEDDDDDDEDDDGDSDDEDEDDDEDDDDDDDGDDDDDDDEDEKPSKKKKKSKDDDDDDDEPRKKKKKSKKFDDDDDDDDEPKKKKKKSKKFDDDDDD